MQGAPPSPVAEIEARQDEVIRLLDELNQRIEWALFELGVDNGGGLRSQATGLRLGVEAVNGPPAIGEG